MERVIKPTLEPMSADANIGAMRAIYPIRDALCYVHGPYGCMFYPRFSMPITDSQPLRAFATGFGSEHIIFGGEELLNRGLRRAIDRTRPKVAVVQNPCVPSLIGDDTEGVCKQVSQDCGIKVIVVNNPNYKGTQLDGYRHVLHAYVEYLMEKSCHQVKRSINLVGLMPGEYNWVINLDEIRRLIAALGLKVNCVLVGNDTAIDDIINAPKAEANVLVYPEVGLSTAKLMQERFGIPFIETQLPPIGIAATSDWLLAIGRFFGLEEEAQDLINQETVYMARRLNKLEQGQIYGLQFLFGKTYSIEGMPFHLPAMVKFLYEDLSMKPFTIAFHEYEASSVAQLEAILRRYQLTAQVQTSGDYRDFKAVLKAHYQHPYGEPWVVFGSTITAFNLATSGVHLPVIRFAFPGWDEIIVTERPFVGFRGVVSIAELLYNAINIKLWYTNYYVGNFPSVV